MDNLYEKLKKIVAETDIKTIAELERLCGFKKRTIVEWQEHSPSIDKVNAVAEVLGTSVDYLLGRTEERDELLEHLARDEELKAFMMTASKCTPEELKALEGMIKAWKRSLD